MSTLEQKQKAFIEEFCCHGNITCQSLHTIPSQFLRSFSEQLGQEAIEAAFQKKLGQMNKTKQPNLGYFQPDTGVGPADA